jgi:uncharacterized protein (TIGR01777 family)
MKVLVAGGTGFIGSRVVRMLVEHKYEVSVFSRDSDLVFSLFGNTVTAITPAQKSSIHIDIIINLAGHNINDGEWTEDKKKVILDSRVRTTKLLFDLTRENPPKILINASAIGIYKSSMDAQDEQASLDDSFLASVCIAWEEQAKKFESLGTKVTILRLPLVLGTEGGAFPVLRSLYCKQLGFTMGSKKKWISWVHVDDAAARFVHAIKEPAHTANVVARAVSAQDFATEMARYAHCLFTPSIPDWLLEQAIGAKAELFKSQRITTSLPSDLGLKFTFLVDALADLWQKSPLTFFYQAQVVNKGIDEIFAFFSQASNLEKLTPSWLHFTIRNQSSTRIAQGTMIFYRLSYHGFPIRWQTLINSWDPPTRFSDEQVRGPYRVWKHEHRFISLSPTKTLIVDDLYYRAPFSSFGLVRKMVDRDVKQIFDFRRGVIKELFG